MHLTLGVKVLERFTQDKEGCSFHFCFCIQPCMTCICETEKHKGTILSMKYLEQLCVNCTLFTLQGLDPNSKISDSALSPDEAQATHYLLHVVCSHGDVDSMKVLIDAGANINQRVIVLFL